jgi:predicted  nucleic acid-binding Zn-ribbon protein
LGEVLGNIVAIITIIAAGAGIVAGITKYVVVNPLQWAISTLNEAVKELNSMLGHLAEEQKNIDKRLVAVEESTKSAHKRIDGMEVHR